MKHVFLLNGIALFSFFLTSCNGGNGTHSPEPEKAGIDIKVSDLASNKDFICDMELSDGGIADTASYEGKLYGFCDPGCKEEFLKDPAKYLSTQP